MSATTGAAVRAAGVSRASNPAEGCVKLALDDRPFALRRDVLARRHVPPRSDPRANVVVHREEVVIDVLSDPRVALGGDDPTDELTHRHEPPRKIHLHHRGSELRQDGERLVISREHLDIHLVALVLRDPGEPHARNPAVDPRRGIAGREVQGGGVQRVGALDEPV